MAPCAEQAFVAIIVLALIMEIELMADNECNEGVYIHVNSKTGDWRVGESRNIAPRAARTLRGNQDCLGAKKDVQTFVLRTCGLPSGQRKALEKSVIDLLSQIRPTGQCNLIRR